jgi:flagellar biosynthetic protein FlhB
MAGSFGHRFDSQIPIIEDKPLARPLHHTVEIEKFLPSQFYRAVAGIICHLQLGKQKPACRIKS